MSRLIQQVNTKFKESDYVTKEYFKLELDARFANFETRFANFETRMERAYKEIIFWLVGAMIGIAGLAIAIVKLF